MTLTVYSNGFGRRDPRPECLEVPFAQCPYLGEDEAEAPCVYCGDTERMKTTTVDKYYQGPGFVACPCCEGDGEHGFGAGMDLESAPCDYCFGMGWVRVLLPN